MAHTEFCCRSGGSNMNGGSLASNAEPATTPVYSATNGGWNSGTGVFTPTSGNPSLTVTVGDFAHVFTDGSTTPTRIARVTAVSSTTVTLSTTVGSGTAPTTAGTGISINVGGAWAGPSGSNNFPASLITSAARNIAGNVARINLKNDQTYNITATFQPANSGAITYQGYTSTFGDYGKAIFDAGGNAITIINQGAIANSFLDLIAQNNGSTNVDGMVLNLNRATLTRLVARNIGGSGINSQIVYECEAYNCNLSNTANKGGITVSTAINCVGHDNPGSNSHGIWASSIFNCIAYGNGGHGLTTTTNANGQYLCTNSDSYNNAGAGIRAANGTSGILVRNCNVLKNGSYGIDLSVSLSDSNVRLEGNGYGSGAMANISGDMSGAGATTQIVEVGKVNYSSGVTPWNDPNNGDFTLTLAAAKNAGWLKFQQLGVIGPTTAYPDIGSAQHSETPLTPVTPTLVDTSPIIWPGFFGSVSTSPGASSLASITSSGAHYQSFVFQAKENMSISHVAFGVGGTASGSPTVDVRIEDVDPATGLPTGNLWAANTNVTSSTLAANQRYTVALGATATILKGQIFCIKFLLNAGTGLQISTANWVGLGGGVTAFPYNVANTTGTPAKTLLNSFSPLLAFGSSSTTFYHTPFAQYFNAGSTPAFNNSVAGTKRGLRIILPFACRVAGLRWYSANNAGNVNIIAMDDAGIELNSSSTLFDTDISALSNSGWQSQYFDNAVQLSANTPYRFVVEPTSSTNTGLGQMTLVSASHRNTFPGNGLFWHTQFTTSGGWVDNDAIVPDMDLILDQVYDGAAFGNSPVAKINLSNRVTPY